MIGLPFCQLIAYRILCLHLTVAQYQEPTEGPDGSVLAGVAIGAIIVLVLLAIIVALFVIKKR